MKNRLRVTVPLIALGALGAGSEMYVQTGNRAWVAAGLLAAFICLAITLEPR